jgi:hypothetical protein
MVPMFLVVVATLMAMVGEVRGHVVAGNWLLATTGSAILILDLWILFEGISVLMARREPAQPLNL